MNEIISKLKGQLIVSCQALEEEPLHSSFIMGRMALAATQSGAGGIRANSVADIKEIKANTSLPIIGIIKKDYPNSNVYISATMNEIDSLVNVGVEIIALDATKQLRPHNLTLEAFFKQVKEKYPNQLFMADISTLEEAINAEKIGFDLVGPTLHGYTEYTKGHILSDNNYQIITDILNNINIPLIAEGNVSTPQIAQDVLKLGVHAIVVGGAITRPQQITKTFVDAINQGINNG